MKKFDIGIIYCVLFTILISGCSTPPEKYFNEAVLNTNLLAGFATNGMARQIESYPSTGGGSTSMKSKDMLDSKIKSIEEAFNKVEGLKPTDETKDMISASVNLYKYVLPVYKTEYTRLAGMYDSSAPAEQIKAFNKSINDKYFPGFSELYNKLISYGKPFAEKNNIKVNWNVY